MPSNTTYRPAKIHDFEASKLNFNAQGVSLLLDPNEQSYLDYTLTDDCLITGAWLIAKNVCLGDTVCLQVLDSAGQFAPPGTILNQFVTNWYLPELTAEQFEIAYPAKILTGMTIRLIYNSIGSVPVFLAINYKLHKVLI